MALSLSVTPTVEPVTLAEVKAHLRVTHSEEDSDIEDFVIPTARQLAELATGRALIDQTWILRLWGFGTNVIVLPKPPLDSVTSIQYVDNEGNTQTWAASNYTVETPSGELGLHASVQPAYNEVYPTTRNVIDSVTITYVAGYGTVASSVPAGIRKAIMMFCEDLYSQRSSQIMGSARSPATITAESLLTRFAAPHYGLRFD